MSLRVRLPDTFVADDDRALVRRFAESRDEAAFAAVVARHARMVYGVCRRAVRDEHLAEDAFQAVFLVLAKDPARAAGAEAVGGWLFGVARRVGLAARRHETRRARREASPSPTREIREPPDFDDLMRVLDEELAALPDEYRAPLVACFLEERTQDEAAKQLGWSLSTLRRRLDRAKELLRARLTRRGATLAAGLFAGALAPSARAAVPPRLLDATSPTGEASQIARTLAAEVGRSSAVARAGLVAVGVAVALGGLAVALAADRGGDQPAAPPEPAVAPAPRQVEAKPWVTVSGRVVFPEKRDLPNPRAVPPDSIKDTDFFGKTLFYQDVVIDPKTRGIANAVVWLRPDSDDRKAAFPAEKVHPALAAAKPADRTIEACRDGFALRVTAARAGDRLVFSNPTPIPFNVRYDTPEAPDSAPGDDTRMFNILLPSGKSYTTKPLPPLPICDTIHDSIHPWVKGYVWAFDHPYSAVTDWQGKFTIKDAPAGTWRLVVWHEKVGYLGGAKGRTGRPVTIKPGGALELEPLVLDGLGWDKD